MAGRPTLWGAGEVLRSFFSLTAEPPPDFYLTLIREVPPNPYITGSELDEPTVDEGFQRAQIPNDGTWWTSSSTSQLHLLSNAQDITFVTATQDLGVFNFWALCNASVDGYVYFFGELEESLLVNTGDQIVLAADELIIELGPLFLEEAE